jgi:hypothetical protein
MPGIRLTRSRPLRRLRELWCDQQIEGKITEADFDLCVKKIAKQVAWYLPE